MSDAELAVRWGQGDRPAGEQLVLRYYGSVFRFFSLRFESASAEDLSQATFETLCRKLDRYHVDQSFRAYLFSIARYKLLEHYRKRRLTNERFDPLTHSVTDPAADRSVTSLLATRAQLSRFYVALRELPVDARILIELKYYEQFTETELGLMYEKPAATMRARVRRARLRLRKVMQDLGASCAEEEVEGYFSSLREATASPTPTPTQTPSS